MGFALSHRPSVAAVLLGLCAGVYKPGLKLFWILTTLAFWLRSSVVSVLYSLTTITVPSGPVCCFLIFDGLLDASELARTVSRDDLAAALLACVVGAFYSFRFFVGIVAVGLFGGVPGVSLKKFNFLFYAPI